MENLHKETEVKEGKSDNFFGNRSIVMSSRQLEIIRSNILISTLYISDIGFYPCAKSHYRRREKGIREHILIYCIDGRGTIQVRNRTHKIDAGSFFVIPGQESHVYWASERNPWSIYWIHFGGERSRGFEEFFCRVIPVEQVTNTRIDDRIKLFNEILTALELGFLNENIIYANLCLNSLLASFFYADTCHSVRGFHHSDPVDQAIFFMQENISINIKMKEIADHVNISESHLSKIFRNKTGSSPIEYFINLKMQEAIRLLCDHSFRVKEVAFRLGYNDPYYFTRLFTRYIGTSPGTFLKTGKKK